MGVDIGIYLSNWDDVKNKLKTGEIDALQGMIAANERSRDFIFSPHSIVNQAVFARRGESANVSTVWQLQGKELIVQKDGYMHDYLLGQGIVAELILVDTHVEALRLLASGKHDYALVGSLPSLYLSNELGLSNIVPVGKPFAGLRYGYAVKKGNQDLLALFTEGITILKKTGRQREIYERWLGPLEPVDGIKWKSVVQLGSLVLGPMVLIIFTVVFWNRSLKREVARRSDEMALQQQQLIQADKMASLGILVSGMAHEINNPNSLTLLNMPIIIEAYEDSQDILEAHYQRHGDFTLGGSTIRSCAKSFRTCCRRCRLVLSLSSGLSRTLRILLVRKVQPAEIRLISIRSHRLLYGWSIIPSASRPADFLFPTLFPCRRFSAMPSGLNRC